MSEVVICSLSRWQEMADVEAIQQAVWGQDPQYIVHAHMLLSIAQNGGLVLCAYVDEIPAGCLISFLGADVEDANRPAMANLKLFSKRLAVLHAYRKQGIGYLLKLAQRDFAMKRGIRLITWTFDPLMSRNAHLNVRKLGVIVNNYIIDHYGSEVSALAPGGSSDRFHAEWWLTSSRVEERLNGSRGPLSLEQYLEGGVRILNPTTLSSQVLPQPSEDFIQPPSAMGLVEIPTNFEHILKADEGLARAWREHSRLIFTSVMKAGYIITDYVYAPHQGRQRGLYVCSHEGSLKQFNVSYN